MRRNWFDILIASQVHKIKNLEQIKMCLFKYGVCLALTTNSRLLIHTLQFPHLLNKPAIVQNVVIINFSHFQDFFLFLNRTINATKLINKAEKCWEGKHSYDARFQSEIFLVVGMRQQWWWDDHWWIMENSALMPKNTYVNVLIFIFILLFYTLKRSMFFMKLSQKLCIEKIFYFNFFLVLFPIICRLYSSFLM